MIDANATNFPAEVLEASIDRPVLVDFSASWCAPCEALAPILEKLERDAQGAIKLVKVDVDDNPALMQAWGVRSLPTVVVFLGGRPVDRFVGARPEAEVRAWVARLAPPPPQDLLAQARNLVALGDWPRAAEVMRTVLALNPALHPVRTMYVQALLRIGEATRARHAFEPLRGRAGDDTALGALGVIVDAAAATEGIGDDASLREAIDAAPDDSAARLRLAQWSMARGRWQPAMDTLLELLRVGGDDGDGTARRHLLAVFALCDDVAMVRDYRRRLAAELN